MAKRAKELQQIKYNHIEGDYAVRCSGFFVCFEQILYILHPFHALYKLFTTTSRYYSQLSSIRWYLLAVRNFTGRFTEPWVHVGLGTQSCFHPFPVVSFFMVGYPIFHGTVWTSINFLLNDCGSSPHPDRGHQGLTTLSWVQKYQHATGAGE